MRGKRWEQVKRSRGVSGFFFQAEDGIRDLVRSRGLGDVYRSQAALATSAATRAAPQPSATASAISQPSATPSGGGTIATDAAPAASALPATARA